MVGLLGEDLAPPRFGDDPGFDEGGETTDDARIVAVDVGGPRGEEEAERGDGGIEAERNRGEFGHVELGEKGGCVRPDFAGGGGDFFGG